MMKKSLFTLFISLLLLGCGQHYSPPLTEEEVKIIANAFDVTKLQVRSGVSYLPNTQEPFSGFAKLVYENGQVEMLTQFKDGKENGPGTDWHENGQKAGENNFKDGKQDGLQDWWYENGQKRNELNYKDGKLISAVAWKPNGEKCPETNVKDGDGMWVLYNWNGTENSRETYKDGEIVDDLPPS